MQSYRSFVASNAQLLGFGFLLALFSAYGQTFLISLYVPEISKTFNLNNTEISSMYATATLASAFTLPWIGRYIDIWPLKRFTLGVITGMFIALLALSFAYNPITVMIGFWGLRLTGQALMGHTSVTTMARAYDQDRGKAISIASVGHPAGEVIFPIVFAYLINQYGWRLPLQFSALSLLILVIPLVFLLLRNVDLAILFPKPSSENQSTEASNLVYSPWKLLISKSFWVLLPGIIFLGAINTAIFFFQIQFGTSRGWSESWVAGSIAAFAIASALNMLVSGPLVDRLSGQRLFPFFLIPYLIGLVLLASFEAKIIYPISLFFMGASNGLGKTITNALYAEIFGTTSIGSVRSIFATVGVFATALGPISFGILLDKGVDYSTILYIFAGLSVLIMVWSIQVWKLKRL